MLSNLRYFYPLSRNIPTQNGRRIRTGCPVQIWQLCVRHKPSVAESSEIPRTGKYLVRIGQWIFVNGSGAVQCSPVEDTCQDAKSNKPVFEMSSTELLFVNTEISLQTAQCL